MKKQLLSLLLLPSVLLAQNVNIPDANFKAYLVGNTSINTNGDSEIQLSEAVAFTGMISCSGLSITNLTGIEAFINLTQLNCSGNPINTLDVSNNTALTLLQCVSNGLSTIDVTANNSLVVLNVGSNSLSSLNITQNPLLQELSFQFNELTSIDISNNPSLVLISGYNNLLTSINLSTALNLTELLCYTNQLTSLNVSANTQLEDLRCGNNSLGSLDISSNPNLIKLSCQNSNLTSLNLKNGNNLNFDFVVAFSNPNLICVEVDNASYSSNNWSGGNFNFETQTIFSENCATFLNVSTNTIDYSINLFPNPAKDQLTIELKVPSQLTVMNLLGELVLRTNLNAGNNTVDVSSYPSGVYLIQVTNEDGSVNQTKFIKE